MRLRWSFLAVLAGMAGGCADGTAPNPAPDLLEALPRALTTQEKSLIQSGNAFTLALFQQASAAEPRKNVFISPLSASFALGMTMNGARNATFDSMRAALRFGAMPQGEINEGYKSLMALLTGLDPTTDARIANSIWYRNTLSINPAFVAAGKDFFGAEVAALDFSNADASTKTINAWVSDKTAGRIPTIIESISPGQVMFLINAIYFKAMWRNGFDRAATTMAPFTAGDGTVQSVPMMFLDERGIEGAQQADGTQFIDLPYGNGAFTMSVFLPHDTTTIERWISRLTPEGLRTDGYFQPKQVQFWMPRVKLEYTRGLVPDLKALGMGIAFDGGADFSGLTTAGDGLRISDVVQKTFLSIDEEGTEAAAVTRVDIFVAAPPPLFTMRCDRPYAIVIRERLSGTILFIGKLNTI